MIEFLKKYQVTEHIDGKWSVVAIGKQTVMGAQLIGSATLKVHGFNTAAEAQEHADFLNEEARNEN